MALFILSNIANLIILIGCWSKDVIWLRILLICGLILILPYYYFQVEAWWAAIAWNIAFVIAHSVRIQMTLAERRPANFSREENALYLSGFEGLTPLQFKKILKIGQWRDLESGLQIQTKGNPAVSQIAILYGVIEARVENRVLGAFGSGDFIGLSCIAANAEEICDMTVIRPTRIMCWSNQDLMQLLSADQQLYVALRKTAGASLAPILIAMVERENPKNIA